MDLEILNSIGLTKGESRVYLVLLEIGQSSVGEIVKKSHVARSKIYDILERLIEKGIASYVIEGKIKKFNAVSPTRLHEFIDAERLKLEKKEEELNKLLPILEEISPKQKNANAEILFGERGIKSFFDMSLYKNKEEVFVMGYSKEASEHFHAYFRDYHKKRIQKKIYGKVIYDYDTWFLKKRGKRIYVKQRYLPRGVKTPAFVYIFGDTVGIIVFTKEQKLCFRIQNKEVADSYREYFNILWKQSIVGEE